MGDKMRIINVYTLPNCVQCNATKKWLDTHEVEYQTTDLTTDTQAFEYVTETLNYKSAPVITVMEEYAPETPNTQISFVSWSGYNPEALEEHCS
jgi:glutaredoxin-like protein NrdH